MPTLAPERTPGRPPEEDGAEGDFSLSSQGAGSTPPIAEPDLIPPTRAFDRFRAQALALLAAGIAPADAAPRWAAFAAAENPSPDLLAEAAAPPAHPAPASVAAALQLPRAFVAAARRVVLHRDPARFELLYRVLWRLRHEPALRHDVLDADVQRLARLAKAVQRDAYKMRAFVRFRPLAADDGGEPMHVAWFEPEHDVLPAVAPWFARRFAGMRWAILTPHRSVRWCPDTRQLTDGPPAQRADAPPADAGEALWLTYYRHIFNPARLNVPLMRQHMPAKYWRNLPEAAEIAALVAAAPTRTARMIEQAPGARVVAPRGARRNPGRVDDVDQPLRTLAELSAAVQHCTACPLAQHATQGVSGSGPLRPPLMLVGEQPGDREDLAGLPFVGPAGQLLDQALALAGIDRAQLYLTNAVRHFKHELRGKRRLHKTPAQREVMACRPWLLREIELVQPQAIVALGATAARALLGPGVKLAALRGQPWPGPGGRAVWVTWHPAALLRLPADERQRTWPMWIADLAHASNAAAP